MTLGKLVVGLLWVLFADCIFLLGYSAINYSTVYGHVIHTAPVMNGFKDKRIGTYAYIDFSKDEMTGGKLAGIYRKIEGRGDNWFIVCFEDGTGILFPGCIEYPMYGELDGEGGIDNPIDINPIFDDSGHINGYFYPIR